MEPADPIVARIERQAAGAGLFEALAERLAPTDLQSLLLATTRVRSRRRTPADLRAAVERDGTVQASDIDGRALHRLGGLALEAASEFDAVELPPVCPLGLNVVLGQVDQNNVLATVRGTEVLADPTTAMALEAARRRRSDRQRPTRLCTTARLLRLQPFEGEGHTRHFSVFAMVSAGRAEPADGFELGALRDQGLALLRLLRAAEGDGYRFTDVTFSVCDTVLARGAEGRPARAATARLEQVRDEIFPAIGSAFPEVRCAVTETRGFGLAYYEGLALQLHVTAPGGQRLGIGDGGCTDWTRRLLSDGKERLLVSAIGLEVMVRLFRAGASCPPP
jgi:hypothetical protein